MAIATGYRECKDCHTRILLAPGVPALNYARDPAGQVAVTFTHPRAARFLGRGEEPGALEHRHSVHHCGNVAEPGTAVQRHAGHGADVTCRPAGNGLCEPYGGGAGVAG